MRTTHPNEVNPMAEFPAQRSTWKFDMNGFWKAASLSIKPPTVVAYTTATVFVNGDRVIDALNNGIPHEDMDDLRAKYPHALIESGDEFSLPLVPVGTVVDITPDAAAAKPEPGAPQGGFDKPAQ
jgi:hypothetical protein